MRSHVEWANKCEGWGDGEGRREGRGGAAELRGERQNLVVSPGGGDALQAPECTQTLSHRGAAQPERARHRALCERERGREDGRRRTKWTGWVRKREGRARDQIWEVKEKERRVLWREEGGGNKMWWIWWMDGWNNVWVYGWKSWRVGEWQDRWSARKGKNSKIMG